MKVARKNTYYVYNAENGEFLGCGSRCDIRKYFNVGLERIESCAKSREPLVSTKNDIILNISKVEGIVENIPFTVGLTRTECNFVEVFKVFKHQEAEEEKEHMRNNFSVINLERVRFELKKHAKESYPYRIAFYTKKSPTTLVFDEYFLSLELAEQRMEYLKNFKGKKDNGDFWYDGVNYEADRVIIATRTRNNRNMIISLDDISTKKTDYDEYLELARFIQSEFIR